MIEGEWNIENAVELTEEAEKVLVYNNFIYHHNLDTKGGFNKLNPLLFRNIYETFFRNGF
jgi:hypothetical protein